MDKRSRSKLLARLYSLRPKVRKAATTELLSVSLSDLLELQRTKYPPSYHPVVSAGLLFTIAFIAVQIAGRLRPDSVGLTVCGAGILFCAASVVDAGRRDRLRRQMFHAITERLREANSIEDLPIVLDLIMKHTPQGNASTRSLYKLPAEMRAAIDGALTRIVPQMDQDAYNSLTWDQRKAFAKLLANPYQCYEASLVTLKALGEYGELKLWWMDSSAGRSKRRLSGFLLKEHRDTRLREAAETALTRIAERQARAKEPITLLRGSQIPQDQHAETLLRATVSPREPREHEMLRAAGAPEGITAGEGNLFREVFTTIQSSEETPVVQVQRNQA